MLKNTDRTFASVCSVYQNPIYMVLLAILLMAVYSYSLLPGLGYMGDTTKFQYVGYVLGTPHWPGYPLYMIVNFLFTHCVPIGTLAYRANMLSAVCAVAACIVLYSTMLKIFKVDPFVAFLTSFLFGITMTLWSQAVIAEVYTLAVVLQALTMFLLFRWRQTRKTAYFIAACASYSISFGAHLWMIVLLPAWIWLVFATDRKIIFNPKIIIAVVALIVLGILQYLYPMWRYHAGAPYLEMLMPDIGSFFNSLHQDGFNPTIFNSSFINISYSRIPLVCFYLIREFSIFIPLAIWGLIRIWKDEKHIAIFLALCIAGDIFLGINYTIDDIFIYMLIGYICIAICCGAGAQAFFSWHKIGRFRKIAVTVFIFLIVGQLCVNYPLVSLRDCTQNNQITKDMLQAVHKNALIVSLGYLTTHCLNYYLLGQGLAEKRNIFLIDQSVHVNLITMYLKENVPYAATTMPGQIIDPGLKVYVAMFIHANPIIEVQAGILFLRKYQAFLKGMNSLTQRWGFRSIPVSIENTHYPSTVGRINAYENDVIEQLQHRGLTVIERTPYLYELIYDKND